MVECKTSVNGNHEFKPLVMWCQRCGSFKHVNPQDFERVFEKRPELNIDRNAESEQSSNLALGSGDGDRGDE